MQALLHLCIDPKIRVILQPGTYCRLWVIPHIPGTVGKEACRHIIHKGIEYYAITAFRDQWSVGIEFGQNMVMGMHGIQKDQHTLISTGSLMDLMNHIGRN